MFLRAKETRGADKAHGKQPGEAEALTLIAADMSLSGNVNVEGDIQIDGSVEGDIRCNVATLSQGSYVQGSIVAKEVYIFGHVKGRIVAPTVTMGETGRVDGTIIHHTMSVEPGAVIDGRAPWRPKADWDE